MVAGEVETVRRPQPVQPHPLELLPHPGLLPLGQPLPAGRTGTEPQLLRQELPLDTCVQDEQHTLERLAVIDPLTPRVPDRRSCFGNSGSITARNPSLTSHGFRRAMVTPHRKHGITHISTVPQHDLSARTPKKDVTPP